MPKLTKTAIKEDLEALGLRSGDTVFVSSDLMRVGYFNKSVDATMRDWMAIFEDILGSDGTIVVPCYSPSVIRYFQKNDFVFTRDSHSDSGSLANAYIKLAENAVRGTHPATSCIAAGHHARAIVAGHGPNSTAYQPYGKIIDLNGKNLMLGTIDEKNCPMPFHYAQEVLGHTRTHPLCGWLETAYKDVNGDSQRYIVREIGGCTRGVHKTWGYHLSRNAVTFGKVGRSLSALVDAKKSYDILLQVLETSPFLIRCDNKYCISCYGRFRYNGFGVIPFTLRKGTLFITKRFSK
jgi:aminoglycoside N3'-acetyltransferase